jgi:hypothetical protein
MNVLKFEEDTSYFSPGNIIVFSFLGLIIVLISKIKQ